MLTERFGEALVYAHLKHWAQTRNGTAIPYVSHLMSVASLVLEYGGDEVQSIAGLLHDAPEDQGGIKTLEDIRERFGENVATIVQDCTDSWVDPKPPWRGRKESYIAALPGKPARSLLVVLADKTHNAESISLNYQNTGGDVPNTDNGL